METSGKTPFSDKHSNCTDKVAASGEIPSDHLHSYSNGHAGGGDNNGLHQLTTGNNNLEDKSTGSLTDEKPDQVEVELKETVVEEVEKEEEKVEEAEKLGEEKLKGEGEEEKVLESEGLGEEKKDFSEGKKDSVKSGEEKTRKEEANKKKLTELSGRKVQKKKLDNRKESGGRPATTMSLRAEEKQQRDMRNAARAEILMNEQREQHEPAAVVGADILSLMHHCTLAGMGDQRTSPTTPNGSGGAIRSRMNTTAVAQKKGVVNTKTEESGRADQQSKTSSQSRGVGFGRPQTPVSKRLATGTASKSANAKLEGATVNSGTRARNIFESSPLATGVAAEVTQLAKSTPSHLIRPTSSVFRPTTSSSAKGLFGVDSPGVGSKQVKSTKSLVGSSPNSIQNSRPVRMGDVDGGGSGEKASLKDQFATFSRFGDSTSDGKQITLSNCDKWMKQAHVIDGKKITTTDTSILFKKLFKNAKKVGFEDFKKYVEDLAASKKIEPSTVLLDKLTNCGAPGHSSATKAAHTGVVERLTDTSKYTGSHKERFDSAGKGRGIEGRRNVQDDSGYVAAFKDKKEEEKKKGESPTPAK